MAYYGSDMGGVGYQDPSAFSDKMIRHGFIRKVYGILLVQLAITTALIALFIFEPNVKAFSRANPGLYIAAMVVTFVLMLVLACCEGVRRSFPVNLILLFIFTLCEGFLLGTVSSYYKADEVIIAVGICAVVCLALTLFAFQTKWDFTALSGILFVCAIVFMCFGFLMIFFHNDVVRLVYACIGALLFSVYLVFDTQLMLGGNHKYSVSPEEYIFASLSLYVDIVNLFLMILQIVGYANRD
ncbi:protein lifeguard 2-like [Ornithodoros turicata]|uniref:protein lifeguard 2-like n=1 Tax=Ornithodoros turicata TaxID=34597 RepID=UPI003138FE63